MTTIINANTSAGLTQTADTSGVLKVQSNGVTTNALAWGSYNYAAGAVPTLRSAYNISSITRNSAGNYTLAFTAAASDANFAVTGSCNVAGSANNDGVFMPLNRTTSSFTINTTYPSSTGGSGASNDYGIEFVVFGN